MKTFILQKTHSLILCFLFMASLGISQTTITIDNNSGSTTTYQTIQEAHDAASAGDIIYVQPSGTSYGAVIIDKAITIVGRSHSEPSKVSQIASVTVRASGVTLKGLKMSSVSTQSSGAPVAPPFTGLNVFECEVSSFQLGEGNTAPTVIIDDVAIRGNHIESTVTIYEDATDVLISNNIFSSGAITFYNTTSAVVANNIFRNYYSSSTNVYFYNYSSSGTAILYNNMFIANSAFDITINFNSGDFNLSNNLTYNYGTGNVLLASNSGGTLTDSNTLTNTDPLFANVDITSSESFAGTWIYNPAFRLEDDLTLQTGSPALTGGGGGSEIGLHNNGFLYNILGNPKGIPTLDVISYDGAVPKNGNINITINAKAN